MTLTISPWRVTAVLLASAVGLAVAGVAGQFSKYVLGYNRVFGLVRLFDLDAEGNVPTWYSALLLFLAAALLGVIAYAKRARWEAYAGHWAALALIFLVLSLDEAASSHEATIQPLRVTLGARGIFYFAWVIPGLALVGLLGVIYWGFMRALPPPTRTRFAGAAAIYVAAALGMEMVGGYVVNYYGQKNITFALLAAAEETLEMLGLVTFVHALLLYLRAEVGPLEIRWAGGTPQGPAAPRPGPVP